MGRYDKVFMRLGFIRRIAWAGILLAGALTPGRIEAAGLDESFASGTFPPAGWSNRGSATNLWRRHSASGYGMGSGSAQAYFWGVCSGAGMLESPVFDAAAAGDAVVFDYAHAAYYSSVDRMEVYSSTDGGVSYGLLLSMPGGPTGILTTAGSRSSSFVPASDEWQSLAIPLPEGVNRLKFDGLTACGNNLYLDNVRVLDYSAAADLIVALSEAPDPVAVGSNLAYALAVSNAGPATAENTVVTNRWSAQAVLVAADSSRGHWTTNANTLIFSLGSLGAGESAAISVVVQPLTAGTLTNTAEAATSSLEPLRGNNRRTARTVADWHGGELLFNPASYVVDESRASVTLTVVRTNGVAGAVAFDYETVDGTAQAGSDYSARHGTLALTNGQRSVSWSVPLLNDAIEEEAESFSVRLSNPAGGARLVVPSNAVIAIRDDDGVAAMPFEEGFESGVFSNYWSTYTAGGIGPQITVSNEPNSGVRHVTLNGTFGTYTLSELVLAVDLNGREGVYLRFWHKRMPYELDDAMSDAFVNHAYADGVAISVNGTNWYKAHGLSAAETGTNEYRQFDVALDPILAAQGKSFTDRVLIKFQMYSAYYPPWYGRFFDDISLYTRSGDLRWAAPGWEVSEGGGAVTVTVERVHGDSGEVSVDYATSDGTAAEGGDYLAATGTLIFANGVRRQSVVVPILQDEEEEPTEHFAVHLFNPLGGAGLGSPTQAVVSIFDDDGPGELAFGAAHYSEQENNGLATITVLRRYGNDGEVAVRWRTQSGTASPGADYVESTGTVLFADGVMQGVFEVPLLDDALMEGPETVQLFLYDPEGGATLGLPTNAWLTIQDDEAPRAAFPLYEGFESGVWSNYWSVRSNGAGRIQLPSGTNALEASRCLAMDSASGYALNEAVLTVDLAGQTSVLLRCWTRNFGDASDPMPVHFTGSTNADGVAMSVDGMTWYRLFDLGGPGAYTGLVADVAAVAAQHGLPLTATFQIKFQHYGNAALTAGGRAFDHISLTPAPPATSTVIRAQGFEGEPGDTWDFSMVPKTGAMAIRPERRQGGTRSLRLTGSYQQNADPYIEFANVPIGAYNNVQLSVAFSASGPDTDDDLYLDISYDNGVTWNGAGSVKLVDGYSNAEIPFGGTNPNNPTTVSNNPWTVNIPAGRTQIKARLRFDERSGAYNNTLDSYFVDDIRLSYQPFGQPPRMEPIGDRIALVSNLLEFVVSADDIDHEVIALAADNLPPGAVFEPFAGPGPVSNLFQFVPDVSQADAIYTVVFHATDSDGVHSETVTVRVLDKVVTFHTNRLVTTEEAGGEIVTVALSRPADAVVNLAVSGSATEGPGGDFLMSATSLVFTADGPREQTITVQLVDDELPEGLESARWSVVNSPDVTWVSDPLDLVILDNDSFRIATANLTSGGGGYYQGPGERILQALQADIVAIQEFRVTNAAGHRAFVDQHFGTNFYYYVEPSSLPNGVISRWPILAAGRWDDPQLSDREFVWATIAVPGGRPLHVVSVHLYYSGGASAREAEARLLTNYLASAGFHPADYVVVCGDLNTQHRNEAALQVLTVPLRDNLRPADQFGDTDTNQNRDKPYDFVLPHPFLNARHLPLHFGDRVFSEGLVFDTRLWALPSLPAPALAGDSGMPSMQHMAVMKLFALDRFVTILTASEGNGSVGPADPEVGVGSNQVFTMTAAPYHHVSRMTANGETWEPAGQPAELVWVWSNVQANGRLDVAFAENLTPIHRIPESWLAGFGITNRFGEAEVADLDDDGVPTWQEHGMDTDPTDPDDYLRVASMTTVYGPPCWDEVWTNAEPYEVVTQRMCTAIGYVLKWPASSNRVYDVQAVSPGGNWRDLAGLSNLVSPGGELVLTNAFGSGAPEMIRIRVRRP